MTENARFPDHRKQQIKRRLQAGQPVMSNDLAAEFAVSEDAIRRDLRALAAEGACQRVYGGALPISPASGPVGQRAGMQAAAKLALARCGSALLRPGQTVFLDASSTNLLLTRFLPDGIRVVTNSVLIAAEMARNKAVEVNVLGGRINANLGGCVDAKAISGLQDYCIDLCFLGACAFAPGEGLAGFDPDDVQFKRSLLRAARASAVLLTTDKLNTLAPYRICRPEDVGTYVLSGDAPQPIRAGLAALGCETLIAEPAEEGA
ncbi:DeoR/GlpR family DNA-binding transcription regulator [Paracoccus sp. PAR01]|uniref:DeoR/GlpR family DNA-binding transcription regulator n=1 Tax=Paracoccus sp. PAR01 TaxID=2769282 RepID=UPI001782E3F4|nr:DeoR/GlpR family DNA-binding transcription regulator [Paracoccus sp. PAR01]MBD9528549.1 DeoR/GlpR transcriptional regulator [Paracoccus sp. PAR01]